MAKQWQEYDPLTGVIETNVGNDWKDEVTVHKQQHMQGLLDRNAYLRNTGATDGGIKKGIWHYCSIPIVIQYELLSKFGLNIHDKNHTDRIFDVINQHYPLLKTTNKTHSRSRSGSATKADSPKPGNSSSIILAT